MHKEVRELIHKTLIISAVVAVIYLLASHFDMLITLLGALLSAFSPLLTGVIIALILNIVMAKLEKLLSRKLKKPRLIALILTYLMMLVIIVLLFVIIIPQVYNSLVKIVNNIPNYTTVVAGYANDLCQNLGLDYRVDLSALGVNQIFSELANSISKTTSASEWVAKNLPSFIASITSVAGDIIGGIISLFMSVLFSIYLLAEKEKYLSLGERLLKRLLKAETAEKTEHILETCHRIFTSYIGGQLLEMFLLGLLFFIVLSIFRIPFALLISLIIALTSMIPYFGAAFACMVGSILVLADSGLIKMIIFIIISVAVQQFENNIIYPNVVGPSVGLPAILVLLAITVFGSLFGAAGMILAVPITAIIYALVKELVESKNVQEPVKK